MFTVDFPPGLAIHSHAAGSQSPPSHSPNICVVQQASLSRNMTTPSTLNGLGGSNSIASGSVYSSAVGGMNNSSGLLPRSRRSYTARSDGSSVTNFGNSISGASGRGQASGMGASGQLPVQVILTTSPLHSRASYMDIEGNGDNDSKAETARSHSRTSSIHVRPLSKKDVFYSGSTLHIPHQSNQHLAPAESGLMMGQSLVSIPARDIIEKVQRQLQKHDKEELEEAEAAARDEEAQQGGLLRRRRNFQTKMVKSLCPFDCYRTSLKSRRQELLELNHSEENEDENKNALDGGKKMQKEVEHQQPKGLGSCFKLHPALRSILVEMLDVSLLHDSRAFMVLALCNLVGMMGFYVPFVYITQYAESNVYGKMHSIRRVHSILILLSTQPQMVM